MQVDIHNTQGDVVGQATLDDSVWGIEPNISVMHQALVRQQANARLGTHETKTRSMVRGGGRKPWRQKGTGRARQGTIRAPQWKGGGVVFGPHPRKYTKAMPRKMRRLAIRSALSAKLRDDRVTVVQGLGDVEGRTKAFTTFLNTVPASRSILLVTPEKVESISRGTANLQDAKTIVAGVLNVRDLLKYDRLVITEEAVAMVDALWALSDDEREPSEWKLARQAARNADAAEEVA